MFSVNCSRWRATPHRRRNLCLSWKSVNFAQDRITALEKDVIPVLKVRVKWHEEEIKKRLTPLEIHYRKQHRLVYGKRTSEIRISPLPYGKCCVTSYQSPPKDARLILLVNAHRLPLPDHANSLSANRSPEPKPMIIRFSPASRQCFIGTAYSAHSNPNRAINRREQQTLRRAECNRVLGIPRTSSNSHLLHRWIAKLLLGFLVRITVHQETSLK